MDEINWNDVIFENDKRIAQMSDSFLIIYFLTKRLFRNWISLNIHILRNTI